MKTNTPILFVTLLVLASRWAVSHPGKEPAGHRSSIRISSTASPRWWIRRGPCFPTTG